MNFTKEQCLFAIRNTAFLERGILESIDIPIFRAINVRLEERIKALGGWKGKYEFLTGRSNETAFARAEWPENQDGCYRACYKLDVIDDAKNCFWLSCALGANGVKACLRFWVHDDLGGRTRGEVERKMLGIAQAAAVKEAGIIRDADNTLFLPFVFDAEVLAAEFPTVDKPLAPLDAALDKFLKVHPQLDVAVKELAAKR